MSYAKSVNEFDSCEEKLKYARSVLLAHSSLGWCEVGKEVVENMPLTESKANSLIESFCLTQIAIIHRARECKRREYESYRAGAKFGYVYLFHLFDDVYKIGRSENPENRLLAISNIAKRVQGIDIFAGINPKLIKIIATPDMVWGESELHDRYEAVRDLVLAKHSFDSYGLTTELFRLSKEQVQEICAIDKMVPSWFEE